MILLISQTSDLTTSDVISWLKYYKKDYIRINQEDKIENLKISFSNDRGIFMEFLLRGKKYVLNEDTKIFIWYRRGFFNIDNISYLSNIKSEKIQKIILDETLSETETLFQYLHFFTERCKKSISSFFKRDVNKLICLHTAKNVGFDIPETLISSKKEDFLSFHQTNSNGIITKGIQNTLTISYEGIHYGTYTEEVSLHTINKQNEKFALTLVQEKLDKKYELRVFYLRSKIFSVAIFSQSSEQTTTDFRKYNVKKPSRIVPYKLPVKVSEQLKEFMCNMGLDSGSIDIVVTKDNRYVFLEVNPVGQFQMIGMPCNYHLDKTLAEELIKL